MPYRMVFYVDGGCRRNGQSDAIGAAAAVQVKKWGRDEHYRQSLPCYPTPTDQRAELTAIILSLELALNKVKELDLQTSLDLTIYSDSKYAVGCMTDWLGKWIRNGWRNAKGGEVANRDLIEEASSLEDELLELGEVTFQWIPRRQNERADELCNEKLDDQDY